MIFQIRKTQKVLIFCLIFLTNNSIAQPITFEVNNSDLVISLNNKDLRFLSKTSSSSGEIDKTFLFDDLSLKISEINMEDKILKSDKAEYILRKNIVNLEKNVSLELKNKAYPFQLTTENLSLNMDLNVMESNSDVFIQNQDISIEAKAVKIDVYEEKSRVTLNQAVIFSKGKKIGQSNSLYFNLFDPLVKMIGSAEILIDDYKINASEISYNFEENKIINSKDSSITTLN
tara:strand:+ start:1663 stop:2355 length:693 start_codon:yes stop_codon:yes gene_type:complete